MTVWPNPNRDKAYAQARVDLSPTNDGVSLDVRMAYDQALVDVVSHDDQAGSHGALSTYARAGMQRLADIAEAYSGREGIGEVVLQVTQHVVLRGVSQSKDPAEAVSFAVTQGVNHGKRHFELADAVVAANYFDR